MRQFFNAGDGDFAGLAERAVGACLRYRDREMPPGASPARADIGFETSSAGGGSVLLVSRGVRFPRGGEEVREWLREGKREFSTFADLRDWVRTTLAEAYGVSVGGNEEPAPVAPAFLEEEEILRRLKNEVIGQDRALAALAAVTARHCAKVDPAKPAVLFAVGPSGVGKTRTCTVLPQVIGAMDAQRKTGFLRLDMSEYQERHRISQLIGAPQGYVGYGAQSQFIETLQKTPAAIVLFDEIEKAHPDILKLLMNVMDAGRVSTACDAGRGREVDCSKAMLLFTSNLLSKSILDDLAGKAGELGQEEVNALCRRRLLRSGVAPEILGRIGTFLVFRPLEQESLERILEIQVKELAREYGLEVKSVSRETLSRIGGVREDGSFGARPACARLDALFGPLFIQAARQAGGDVRSGRRVILEEVSAPPDVLAR